MKKQKGIEISKEAKDALLDGLAVINDCAQEIQGNESHDDINFKAEEIPSHIEEILRDFGIPWEELDKIKVL